jgi:hypothetical protein
MCSVYVCMSVFTHGHAYNIWVCRYVPYVRMYLCICEYFRMYAKLINVRNVRMYVGAYVTYITGVCTYELM